jgi:hypothetical protein
MHNDLHLNDGGFFMWRPLLTLSVLVVSAPLLAIEVPQAPHLVVSGYAEQKAEPDMLTLNVAVTALEKQGIKAKQQGVGLNIGVFKFDAEVESFNGCQQNYELA